MNLLQFGVRKGLWFYKMVVKSVIRQPFYFVLCMLYLVLPENIVLGYQEDGYLYLSPLPSAEYVPAETSILIRFASITPFDLTNLDTFIKISGDRSGGHEGDTHIAGDGQTIIFKPYQSFYNGEMVSLPEDGRVSITIYNLLGQEVDKIMDKQMSSDLYVLTYDAAHLSTGIYMCQMIANGYKSTQKMLFLK